MVWTAEVSMTTDRPYLMRFIMKVSTDWVLLTFQ